jgi:hypothetical protein
LGIFDRFFEKTFGPQLESIAKSNALLEAIESHSREYFFGEIPSLARLPSDVKQAYIDELNRVVSEIFEAKDSFLEMRAQLVSHALLYAHVNVLSMTEDGKVQLGYGDERFISGELHHHIRKLWTHCVPLTSEPFPGKAEDTDKELLQLVGQHGAFALYYMNGLNKVRVGHFKDFIEERDWFRPLVRSLMILSENSYRSEIGLPSLLEKSHDEEALTILPQYVTGGHKDPYTEWKQNIQSLVLLDGVSESLLS